MFIRRQGGDTREEMKMRERKEKNCELGIFGGTLDFVFFLINETL